MESQPMDKSGNSEPTVSLRLSLFLEILWGYRKSDLRDKAVPGKEVVAALEKLECGDKYFYLQKQDGCETIVWQIHEWRNSGQKFVEAQKKSEIYNYNVETVIEAMQKKLPMLGKEFLSTVARTALKNNNMELIYQLGVKEEDLRK
jgi:hypothetical protein